MKRYRFSLMAGLLALGVAACGDDVSVISPTPLLFRIRRRRRSRPRWPLLRPRSQWETVSFSQ